MGHKNVQLSRRSFFRGAVQASAVGAMAGASLTGQAEAYTPGGDETRARYRETDHVKAFYETNRYETKNKN